MNCHIEFKVNNVRDEHSAPISIKLYNSFRDRNDIADTPLHRTLKRDSASSISCIWPFVFLENWG